MEVPLPWERLLWSARSWLPDRPSARYFLTDFRLVRVEGDRITELALDDIADIHLSKSRLDRLTGTSTLTVQSRRSARALVLHGIRKGSQLAAVLELLAGEAPPSLDADGVRAALAWSPRVTDGGLREAAAGLVVVLIAVFGVVIGLHGKAAPEIYSPDDPIAPNGQKRNRAEIVRFMEREVMPWARVTFGPIKGNPDRITCDTCHGANAEARGWQMPAVARLPQPEVRNRGWERYSSAMDAQMRNAIYGYIAEPEKQARAAYMREVVMPGIARLLERPPYDFTKTYDYNRSRRAFGCYHCHRVK